MQHLGTEQGRLVESYEENGSLQRFNLFTSFDHLDYVKSPKGSSGMTQKRDEHHSATKTLERDHLIILGGRLVSAPAFQHQVLFS